MKEVESLLLADDDFDDAYFFKEAIQAFPGPVKIDIVKDGDQLMRFLHANVDNPPSLVFLDLNMPRKNGLDCLREIKNSEKLNNIPVIIYSTADQQDVIKLLYKAGAQFYIKKPDNFSKLKAVVHKALDLANKFGRKQPAQDQFIITL